MNTKSQPYAGIDPDLAFVDREVALRLFGATPPQRIGRFPVVDVLGSGGMGLVYLAVDDHLQRRIAIKLLNSQSRTAEGVERLLREARAMARLSHPGVVPIYEAGVHSGQVFIAMEYIQGSTLCEWAARTHRPWRAVCKMFVAIGKGVCAAHAAGIIHRDLKPSNILIDVNERPKVADFGLAREEAESPSEFAGTTAPDHKDAGRSDLTVHGALLGTPRYMSPEQHQGEAVSFASDQYSFCIVMWEALYRRYPFAVADEGGLCAAKVSGQVVAPPSSASVPARLRKALLRGLHPDPADRWPSMQALVVELERDLWPRRLPWLIAVAGLLVAPGAYLTQYMSSEVPGETCAVAAVERMANVWNDDVRGVLSQHFARADADSGVVAAWEVLAPELDRYRDELSQARQSLCLLAAGPAAGDRRNYEVLARFNTCLEHRLLMFSDYVGALQEIPPASFTSGTIEAFFDPGVTPRDLGPVLGLRLRLPAIAACQRTGALGAAGAGPVAPIAPETRGPVRDRIAALARVQALETLGHEASARAELERHLPALKAEGPADLLPEYQYLHGRLLRKMGHIKEAREALYHAEQLAERAWRDDLLVAVRLELGMVAMEDRATLDAHERESQPFTAGREYDRAVAILQRNGGEPTRDLEFMKLEAMISDHRGQGDWGRRVRARIFARAAEDTHSDVLAVQLLAQFANQYAKAGLLDAAMEIDAEVVDRAQDVLGANHMLTGDVAYNAAMRLFKAQDARRFTAGMGYLDLAMQVYRTAPGATQRHGMAEHAAASLLLHAGESELAWPYARRAFALVREQPDRLGLAFSLRLQGLILLRRREYDEAGWAAAEALRVLEGLAPSEDVRRWRQHIKLGLLEALVYQRRVLEARVLHTSLARKVSWVEPPALSAELTLRSAQTSYLLGDDEAAVRTLVNGNKSGDLCNALTDPLAVGDVHALATQLFRQSGKGRAAERHRALAIANYRTAGSDGRDREQFGPPWSLPVSGPERSPF